MENLFTSIIKEKTIDQERALYGLANVNVQDCDFDGTEPGAFCLKDCRRINVHSCFFNLPSPLWHADHFTSDGCRFTEKAKEALWYDSFGTISNSDMLGEMALRECHDIRLRSSVIDSSQFGWKCSRIILENDSITSEYLFMDSKDIQANHITMKGEYAFRYTENVTIGNSHLNTDAAFWHGKNITIKNSVIEGSRMGWYSDGLTLENCTIIGEQPFYCCKNLKLVNCKLENCRLAFENAEVEATIFGKVDSIINPLSGHITLDAVGEVIITEDSKQKSTCEIITRE